MLIRFLTLVFVLSAAACDKSSENDCQKAVDNINKVLGITADRDETAPEVRKCRAQWKKAAVQCAMAAKTKEEVEACEGGK
jgi:hypothetical protein